jgi:hydroxymethylpyrimidine pyrophosphatase-like HAD family hydrolase
VRDAVLCTDYDGTLADRGRVGADTVAALERLRAADRRLVLVTGRELSDLRRVFDRLDLFDRVVAENGALLHTPDGGIDELLAAPPPPRFVEELRRENVAPLSVGRVIVATDRRHEAAVAAVIARLALALEPIPNKESLMVLPRGVDKATGLTRALQELGIPPASAVGVGDAENDLAFLAACGFSAAVANALPSVKSRVDLVLASECSRGVEELVFRMLRGDIVPDPRRADRESSAIPSGRR